MEPWIWARLFLCLLLSGLLHGVLLMPEWRSKPAVPPATGQAVRVALVEAPAGGNSAGQSEAKTTRTLPPYQGPAKQAEGEIPEQMENRIQPDPAKEVRNPAPKPRPQKSAPVESPPEIRRQVAQKPHKTTTEADSQILGFGGQQSPPEADRRDHPNPEKRPQGHPDQAHAGSALVFPCVDLLCRERTDLAVSTNRPGPKRDALRDEPPRQGARAAAAEAGAATSPGASALSSGRDFVDATPRYQSNPLPEYPYLARQRHWEGEVWLLVTVSARGRVEDLEVAASSGYGALDKSALNSVRRWRFFPAEKAGVPVASQVKVPVRFQLQD